MSSTDLDRFKMNILMWSGFLWIAVSGGCSAWWLIGSIVYEFQHQGEPVRYGQGMFTYAPIELGPFFLLPGLLAWQWGKRGAGYDSSRDLKNALWRLPQIIGVAWAIWCWILGAAALVFPVRVLVEGHCFGFTASCNSHVDASIWSAFAMWVPGWILYWASTRP